MGNGYIAKGLQLHKPPLLWESLTGCIKTPEIGREVDGDMYKDRYMISLCIVRWFLYRSTSLALCGEKIEARRHKRDGKGCGIEIIDLNNVMCVAWETLFKSDQMLHGQ